MRGGLCGRAIDDHASPVPRLRVLLVTVVRDGRWLAPSCLSSAATTREGVHHVDALVIDDRHPDEASSRDLHDRCDELSLTYYRSPRRLGVARGMNLGLGRAVTEGYDHALLVRSPAVLPQRIADAMIRVTEANAGIGSVTAWSNLGSSLVVPSGDGMGMLRRAGMVDWVATQLADEFGSSALDIPAGAGPCMLIPVPAVVKVGQFDPVYRSGGFETVDWCLRSRERGCRAVLAPSAFVLEDDRSGVRTAEAHGEVTVTDDEERVVDLRYPWRRADESAFTAAGALDGMAERAVRSIVVGAIARTGYEVVATWVPGPPDGEGVRFVVDPDGRSLTAHVDYCGFRTDLDVPGGDLPAMLTELTGIAPTRVALHDRGLFADQLSATWAGTIPFDDRRRYPQRI